MNLAKLRLITIGIVGALAFCTRDTLAGVQAQTARTEIRQDACRSAGTYYAYPEPNEQVQTPAPGGKKPFFINHFGSQGSYFHDKPEFYESAYHTLAKADSLGKLTALGQDVMQRLDRLCQQTKDRSGELTERGARQQQAIVSRMVIRCPEVFQKGAICSARSTTINRCIMAMEHALQKVAQLTPTEIVHKASQHNQYYLNPQDKALKAARMDSLTQARYDAFCTQLTDYDRLMASLFRDATYVSQQIDVADFGQQLFDLAGSIQNTELNGAVALYDLFTEKEIYDNWRRMNAWWYINYGGCTLNGGLQPYTQRVPLRKLIETGDSINRQANPVIYLRYTTETVIVPLACLMELNDFGLATDRLETIDQEGWADFRIGPMGSNIQIIHYRRGPDDEDVLVKVLLNERETTLPVSTDCAPYYHWRDVRDYYLTKLDAYEKL